MCFVSRAVPKHLVCLETTFTRRAVPSQVIDLPRLSEIPYRIRAATAYRSPPARRRRLTRSRPPANLPASPLSAKLQVLLHIPESRALGRLFERLSETL